jgi:hypothetical protein
LNIIKLLGIIYSFIIIGFGALISAYRNNYFTKDKVFNDFPIGLISNNRIGKFLFFKGVPLILITLFYVVFISNTSIAFGSLFFIFIFFAFSSFTGYWALYKNQFRYVQVFFTESNKKSEFGRLRAIDDGLLRIQSCRKKDDNWKTFLKIIPLHEVERVELRELDEIKENIKCT